MMAFASVSQSNPVHHPARPDPAPGPGPTGYYSFKAGLKNTLGIPFGSRSRGPCLSY